LEFLLKEKGRRSAMLSLADFWPQIKGTNDVRLIEVTGEILIQNGYSNWSFRWLLERYLLHPTSEKIISLLTESSSEILDHELIRFCGELSLATGRINLKSIERLLESLLALGDEKRCLEILSRIEHNRKTIKMIQLELRIFFYGEKNPRKVIDYFLKVEKQKQTSEIIAHAALAYLQNNDLYSATNILQPLVDKGDPNATVTMFEILREKSPQMAIKSLNKLFARHGWAPLSNKWATNEFKLSNLSCGKLESSKDTRLVSVIMTAHQNNPMMETAVQSILDQTHKAIELIIVDDFSTAEDKAYYETFTQLDKRVKVIHQQKNKGTYSARNRGLEEISTDFVMFVDSDDWSHPQRIEYSLKRFDENPNCIFATEGYTRLNENGELTLSGGYFVRRCMLGLWRTEIIRDELGGFDDVRIAADAEVFERAQKRYGTSAISTLQIPSYIAYSHEKSLTGGGDFSIGWRGVNQKRAAYAGSFRTWHKRLGNEISVFNLQSNINSPPFRMPVGMQRSREFSTNSPMVDKRFIAIHNDLRSSIVDSITQPLVPADSDDSKPKITVCMATFPKRFKQIKKTVEYLIDQTIPPDEILIHVNESDFAPELPDDARVKVYLSPNENLTDIGKIKMVDHAAPGIIILADDDLHYPNDYIEKMVNHVQRFNGEACVGTHGIVFPFDKKISDIDQYFSTRRVHHFKHGQSIDFPCHALGTGTMAFDSRKIKFDWEKWGHGKMVDLHVAVENQRKGIQMVIVSRESNWIKSFSEEPDDISIWKEVKSNLDLQTKMIEVLSVVKNWDYYLSRKRRISGQELLKSDPIDETKTDLEIPMDFVRFTGEGGYEPLKRWKQKGRILYFETPKRTIQFEMPFGWEILKTHPDIFQLAHYVLMYPFEANIMENWKPTRTPGCRPGLSFSGGIDSTACLDLMPKNTIALYHERTGFPSVLSHTNAYSIIEKLEHSGTTVYRVPSNHELIRTDYGKAIGFSSDFSAGVHAILLADYLNLDSIAFGLPLENSFLFHGHKGRNFIDSKYWIKHSEIFSSCGLELFYPSAGLSEFINLKIVNSLTYGELAQSCLRSKKSGEVCGICWKCFRKNSMRGEKIIFSAEVNAFLSKKPLKQAASTLYALQKLPEKEKQSVLERFPHLNKYIQLNFNFLERYHPSSELFVPEQYRKNYLDKLQSKFDVMTEEEVIELETMDLFG
jgi:glycosyltransferase involved in cell wall biosynthesis